MPENVIKSIEKMLNEEKWTRATLNDFTISNFDVLNDIINTVMAKGIQNEVEALCEEHIANAKKNISALYISGVLTISKHQIDDAQLVNLIGIFADHHKWTAVEYLCNRILDFGENKDVLRTLAETLENHNRLDEMYKVWERLIKVDYSETDIIKRLAEKKEQDGNLDEAILYYRKSIHRYVNKNKFNNVREIWKKLVETGVDDYEFFFLIERKVCKSMSNGKAINLLEDLYPAIKKREEWATAINVLKRILTYDGRNNWARLEIIECYKSRYADHSQVEEYIRLSNLNQNWRNVNEAIADFEKHISFDAGNFVFHKTWGVGIIKEIKGDTIQIDFTKKRGHDMSLKMAVGALQSLTRNHIWVLKSIHSKDKLKQKIKNDIPWALNTIIRSFDNVADIKKIKAELVPSILTSGEWATWNSEARTILKTNPKFGNRPDKIEQFVVRDKPMSFEEKTFNQFKAEKNIFGKIQSVRDFLDHSDPDSEFFVEMFEYFKSLLNTGNVNVQIVASYLFVSKIVSLYPFLDLNLDWDFKTMWSNMDDPIEISSQLEDAELKRQYLTEIRQNIDEWPDIYIKLFPVHMSMFIIEELLASDHLDAVLQKFEEIVDHYREYRESIIWLLRHISEKSLIKELNLNYDKILINVLRLLILTYNEIETSRNVSKNRRLLRQMQSYLFKEDMIKNYIETCNEDTAKQIQSLLDDITYFEPVIGRDLQSLILNRFPKLKTHHKPDIVTTASSRYFYTFQSNLTTKQKELKHIIEVEIPRNSKEIGAAIELGDLSENAEYKAGKEKQENLQIQVGKLKEEIERARVFKQQDRMKDKIGFGTKIILDDLIESCEQSYTILGPWESNPSEKIISYLSPFGSQFIGKGKGDKMEFEINDRSYKFIIKDVHMVDIA